MRTKAKIPSLSDQSHASVRLLIPSSFLQWEDSFLGLKVQVTGLLCFLAESCLKPRIQLI